MACSDAFYAAPRAWLVNCNHKDLPVYTGTSSCGFGVHSQVREVGRSPKSLLREMVWCVITCDSCSLTCKVIRLDKIVWADMSRNDSASSLSHCITLRQ